MKRVAFALLLLLCGQAAACSCGDGQEWLAYLEKENKAPQGIVLHVRVKRLLSPTAIEVEVLESFSGALTAGATTVLHADNQGNSCDYSWGTPPGFTGIFRAREGNLVHMCGLVLERPKTLERLREVSKPPQIPGLPRFRVAPLSWLEISLGAFGALLIAFVLLMQRGVQPKVPSHHTD